MLVEITDKLLFLEFQLQSIEKAEKRNDCRRMEQVLCDNTEMHFKFK